MTEEERSEAKRLAMEYHPALREVFGESEGYFNALDEVFMAGYAAACEAKREYCKTAYSIMAAAKADLELERARSAKLFHLLQSIERRARTASMGSSFVDLMEVAEWAADALAECEAGRD